MRAHRVTTCTVLALT